MNINERIVFTGGGTGGHVFPGLAIIDEIRRLAPVEIVWVGSRRGMERRIVERAGIRFIGVPCGKLRRYLSAENLLDLFRVIAGIMSAFIALVRFRPALVFSKGGYVSVPVVVAAGILRIRVFTHESDYDPGIATRINAVFADLVLTSFPDTARFFPAHGRRRVRIECTGNPVRTSLLDGSPAKGRAIAGCPEAAPLLLVLGGSLGARAVNDAIASVIERLSHTCYVVHQMGARHFIASERTGYVTAPFFGEELADIFAAADLVVCRAGSNTLWELAALGLPSVLVPLPASGSRGDQLRNAAFFERAGASVVVQEGPCLGEKLLEIIEKLINNGGERVKMKERAFAISRRDAAAGIARLIQSTLSKKRR